MKRKLLTPTLISSGYERSVLRRLADTIKIAIRGGQVEIIVSKNFAK